MVFVHSLLSSSSLTESFRVCAMGKRPFNVVPKRGKERLYRKRLHPPGKLKRPTASYTRCMKPKRNGVDVGRRHWAVNVFDFKDEPRRVHDILRRDKICITWSGRKCPFCGIGEVKAFVFEQGGRGDNLWRCRRRACHRVIHAFSFHPIFKAGH